eukprot:Gb_17150 [translate_table: standard]
MHFIFQSFGFGAFALAMATLSTGIDPKSLSVATKERDTGSKIPYGYGFFHFIFVLASMYLAMLLLGWNLQKTMQNLDNDWSVGFTALRVLTKRNINFISRLTVLSSRSLPSTQSVKCYVPSTKEHCDRVGG